jgi:hypothetical protein
MGGSVGIDLGKRDWTMAIIGKNNKAQPRFGIFFNEAPRPIVFFPVPCHNLM